MYDFIINEYINKLSVNDILNYAMKKNIKMEEYEAIIILSYAKKYYKELLHGNPQNVINELRDKLTPNTFKEAYKLYIEAKIKYLDKFN